MHCPTIFSDDELEEEEKIPYIKTVYKSSGDDEP